jgi:uncharacterized surface protein with fasciclin (FAS1) repeats
MTEKQPFYKKHRNALIVILVLGLGPLTALTFGSKYADEETIERAQAGAENIEPEDRYEGYELPDETGGLGEGTVLDVTADNAVFEQFQRLVKEAEMTDVLKGTGPFTVFVPTDEAFANLSEERKQSLMNDRAEMKDLVSNHIVRGLLGAADLLQKQQVETLGGRDVKIGSGGRLSFGDAEIVKSNLVAGNGVVHVVDALAL